MKRAKISVLNMLRQKIWNMKITKSEFLEVVQNCALVENFRHFC